MSTIAPTGVLGLLVHLLPLFGAVGFAVWMGVRHADDGLDRKPFHYTPDKWEGSE